jgi:hypothetical protein
VTQEEDDRYLISDKILTDVAAMFSGEEGEVFLAELVRRDRERQKRNPERK